MIRAAKCDDISSIRALMESASRFWHETWREDVLERGICAAHGLAFVWEEADSVLGFICAHDLGFRGYISELIVSEEVRGKGIGKKLVEHAQEKLAEAGCSVVIADVWRDAERFYTKLGWESPEAILLRKNLSLT